MELSNTVYAVRTNDGQASHVNLTVLNDRQLTYTLFIIRISLTNLIEVTAVNLVNDHVDTWQQFLHQVNAPLLQCLRHDGMVGVTAGIYYDIPSSGPVHLLFINQNTHELCYAQCWMGIVDMDSNLVREIIKILVSSLVGTDDTLNTSGYEEILLYQTELAALEGTVIWVQILSNAVYPVTMCITLMNLLLI